MAAEPGLPKAGAPVIHGSAGAPSWAARLAQIILSQAVHCFALCLPGHALCSTQLISHFAHHHSPWYVTIRLQRPACRRKWPVSHAHAKHAPPLLRHFCTVWPQADPVDPKPQLEEECHAPCKKHWDAYLACEQRIAKAGKGQCQDWAFDYWGCLDKCVRGGAHMGLVCCGG